MKIGEGQLRKVETILVIIAVIVVAIAYLISKFWRVHGQPWRTGDRLGPSTRRQGLSGGPKRAIPEILALKTSCRITVVSSSARVRQDAVAVSTEVLEGGVVNHHRQGPSMKINRDRVLEARKQKSWSQEELATAAGLNLRTVQRIEGEASASLQSKKALASALDLDIHDLDYQETRMRQEWEYKVVETKNRTALQPELASAGAEGWELVSATAMFNTLMTKVVYTLILKRVAS
jgi:transcriptional regulator with XRE-family HTH domain